MIDMDGLFELIESGAIETYFGEVEVLRDLSTDLFVIGQGERMLVLTGKQAADLVMVLEFKLRGGL